MLGIGNIYELKLSKKIPQHGLLIFDINENTHARLHKSNLSNNPILSQKMFELFDVGHEVTVLVTDFNEERNSYELSTKAFRNSLDNILNYTYCKNLIEEQFQRRNNQDPMFLLENRRILDRLRGDLASTGLTFLYELLQNAVDHPNKNFNDELTIHFEVFNNYLLLKHNGALFTEDNFQSICGILYGEQQNEEDPNRIGYKGIGFKSVFRHTNNVYIRSGNFSFCFNKAKIGDTKPWEVMPVFQNEIDKIDEIPQFDFFNSPVAFAFEFPSEEQKTNVIKYLTELAQNPYLVIFLDKLKKLKIATPNNDHLFEKEIIKDEGGNNTIRLKIDGSDSSDWISFSDTYLIEEQNIINELTDENNKSIPDYFRQFRKPKIDLIIPLNRIKNPINVFAYLPLSATRYQIDYIVNGDFIPNLDRSNIIENLSYNFKLVEFAATQILGACKSFALQSKFSLIKRLFPSFEVGNSLFKNSIQKSFIEGVKGLKIFPSYYDGKLNSFENTLIDYTELYKILPQNQYNALTNTTKNPLNPASELQKEYIFLFDKLKNGEIFRKEELVTCLKTETFKNWLKNPLNSFLIIVHFHDSGKLKELAKTENIFLNSRNELVSSTSLYCNVPDEISFIGINVINSELYELIKSKELPIKLLNFEPVEFYKKHILNKETIINSLLTTENNLINFWKFIYKYWENFEKEKSVINSLKNISIICKSRDTNSINYQPVSSCYLSIEFNPKSDIESVINSIGITDVDFISKRYNDINPNPDKWGKIFKKAGVISNLQDVIDVLIPKLSSINVNKHFEIGKQIFKYWKDNTDKETQLSESQITVVTDNLKIKCRDGSLLKSSDCIIADYYTTNPIIDTFLPEIKLSNQISDDYEKRNSNIPEWNKFFRVIGCKPLLERQDVLDAKVEFYIKNQDKLQDSHFLFLKGISNLYKDRKQNKIEFEFGNKLSAIKLKTYDDQWLLPSQIHFSSNYNPKLDLQADESIKDSYKFLCEQYKSIGIEKPFLYALGVNSSFKFLTFELKRDAIPLNYRQLFESKSSYIKQNAINYANQHRLKNHIELNYIELLKFPKYSEIFWEEVIKPNSKLLKYFYQNTTYRMAFSSVTNENYVVAYLKSNCCFPNQEGKLAKTTDLYSYLLSAYITNKKLLPKYDLTKIYLDKDPSPSLEEILGIQNQLSIEQCIELLSRLENRIDIGKIERLEIINILEDYTPKDSEKDKLFLLNKNLEWKKIDELFITSDEQFQIESTQQIHEVFSALACNFGVKELSEANIVLHKKPKIPTATNEIKDFFKHNTKFIAFKINHINYEEIETEILKKITFYNFFEVTSISKVFPDVNPIYKKDIEFYFNEDEKNIFFKGNWKTNSEIISFLFKLISDDRIEKLWFENLINRWDDDKIIEKLNEEVGTTPAAWDSNEKGTNNNPSNEDYLAEVKGYIDSMKEVEDIYDEDKVQELKNLLAAFIDQPDGKRKAFNLLAKLKLCKQEEILYDDNWEYNKVISGEKKFFIHSARGSFAYIHPNEILQMKDNCFKMAIDFGTQDLRIYDTHSDVIKLYQNYLMLYQGDPIEEEILSLCEENQDREKFHFLIVDREKQTEEALALRSILNSDLDE